MNPLRLPLVKNLFQVDYEGGTILPQSELINLKTLYLVDAPVGRLEGLTPLRSHPGTLRYLHGWSSQPLRGYPERRARCTLLGTEPCGR